MIAKLKGTVDHISGNSLILDVQGVGYLLSCSQTTIRHLPGPGEYAVLQVETFVRPENIQLYGFLTETEKEIFKVLLNVQGVGGKVCLALLSILNPRQIYDSIIMQNEAPLTKAEGVGPKLAQRIIRELKDKILTISFSPSSLNSAAPKSSLKIDKISDPEKKEVESQEFEASQENWDTDVITEGISALVNLGYRSMDAREAILNAVHALKNTNPDAQYTLNSLIPMALQNLGKI